MTTTQLIELLLLRLYDSANAHGRAEPVDLAAVAAEIGETDPMKVYNAGKALESRGLIRAAFRYGGDSGGPIDAWITSDGELLVEHGGMTGIIADFRRNPQRFMVSIDQSRHFHGAVSNSNIAAHSQVSAQSLALRQEQLAITERIADTIQKDLSLADEQRRHLLADVRTLRDELQRPKPRGGLIRDLLGTLSDVSSIAGLIIQLQPHISKILS
jgi:hypothetical protein